MTNRRGVVAADGALALLGLRDDLWRLSGNLSGNLSGSD